MHRCIIFLILWLIIKKSMVHHWLIIALHHCLFMSHHCVSSLNYSELRSEIFNDANAMMRQVFSSRYCVACGTRLHTSVWPAASFAAKRSEPSLKKWPWRCQSIFNVHWVFFIPAWIFCVLLLMIIKKMSVGHNFFNDASSTLKEWYNDNCFNERGGGAKEFSDKI